MNTCIYIETYTSIEIQKKMPRNIQNQLTLKETHLTINTHSHSYHIHPNKETHTRTKTDAHPKIKKDPHNK